MEFTTRTTRYLPPIYKQNRDTKNSLCGLPKTTELIKRLRTKAPCANNALSHKIKASQPGSLLLGTQSVSQSASYYTNSITRIAQHKQLLYFSIAASLRRPLRVRSLVQATSRS